MQEHVAAHDAILGIVAMQETGNVIEVFVAVLLRRGRRGELPGNRFGATDARLGRGMRRQPIGHALFTERIDARERRQESRHARRVPASAGSVLNTQAIGLEFGGAVVLQEQHPKPRRTELGERLHAGHEDAQDR